MGGRPVKKRHGRGGGAADRKRLDYQNEDLPNAECSVPDCRSIIFFANRDRAHLGTAFLPRVPRFLAPGGNEQGNYVWAGVC